MPSCFVFTQEVQKRVTCEAHSFYKELKEMKCITSYDVDDLIQDFNEALLRHQHTYEPSRGTPSNFARTIIKWRKNDIKKYLLAKMRDARKNKRAVYPDEDEEMCADCINLEEMPDSSIELEDQEFLISLDFMLKRRDYIDAALVKGFVLGRKIPDISADTGIHQQTLYSRIPGLRKLFQNCHDEYWLNRHAQK